MRVSSGTWPGEPALWRSGGKFRVSAQKGLRPRRIFNALNLRCRRVAAARAIQGVRLEAECLRHRAASAPYIKSTKDHPKASSRPSGANALRPRLEGQIFEPSASRRQTLCSRQDPAVDALAPAPWRHQPGGHHLLDRQEDRTAASHQVETPGIFSRGIRQEDRHGAPQLINRQGIPTDGPTGGSRVIRPTDAPTG